MFPSNPSLVNKAAGMRYNNQNHKPVLIVRNMSISNTFK